MALKFLIAVAAVAAALVSSSRVAEAQPIENAGSTCPPGSFGCTDGNSFMSGLSAPYDMRCQPGFVAQVYPNGSGFRCLAVEGPASYPKP